MGGTATETNVKGLLLLLTPAEFFTVWLLYDIVIHGYQDSIRIASLFNSKARQWVRGRKNWARTLKTAFESRQPDTKVIWFHCASLGEFEQGRPVIEGFRERNPGWKILLTFFSPSGYEVRKNYLGADWICYLPLDSPGNARRFIRITRPDLAVFVKYEFWFRYLDLLWQTKVPVYVISSIFRERQHFFLWYGKWARRQLNKVSHFFVQDDTSVALLKSIGIDRVTLSGDTRFDRVARNAENTRPYPIIERYTAGQKVLLAGSTWPVDEQLLVRLIREGGLKGTRMIITPHEVHDSHLKELAGLLEGIPFEFYTRVKSDGMESLKVLIVDHIGFLSHLYRYATVAYIGGGFGTGIHNILEAATFGVPVIFGPNYGKFREARDLIGLGGATSLKNYRELKLIAHRLIDDPNELKRAGEICRKYVQRRRGATEAILEAIAPGRHD